MSDLLNITVVDEYYPSRQEISFNRDSILKGPDWRWSTAQVENFCERNSQTYIKSTDPYVLFAKRMQLLLENRNTRLWFEHKWKPAYEIIQIATSDRFATMHKTLDISLIRCKNDQEVLDRVVWLKPDQLRLYKKLFFDMSGITAVHEWMEDHIFRPVMNQKDKSRAFKLLAAYYSGYDVSASSRIPNKEESKVLTNIMNNERLKAVVEYVTGGNKLPLDVYAGFMESALKDIQLERKEQDLRDGSGEQVDPELANMLVESTKLMSSKEIEEKTQSHRGLEVDFEMDYIRNRWAQLPSPETSTGDKQ